MVVTHKQMKDQKAKKIHVKEDNPARKFMTHDEAVADSKRIREERDKVEQYKQRLKDERLQGTESQEVAPPEKPVEEVESSELDSKIAKLQAKLEAEKGPGSRKRKEAIQAEIDALILS